MKWATCMIMKFTDNMYGINCFNKKPTDNKVGTRPCAYSDQTLLPLFFPFCFKLKVVLFRNQGEIKLKIKSSKIEIP
jgi:hypothetical protein